MLLERPGRRRGASSPRLYYFLQNRLRPGLRGCDIRAAVSLWVFPNIRSPLERITEGIVMITASDHEVSARTLRTGNDRPAADAALFALIDELAECEKRREDLLNRLSIDERG